jgi:hypothetical protein
LAIVDNLAIIGAFAGFIVVRRIRRSRRLRRRDAAVRDLVVRATLDRIAAILGASVAIIAGNRSAGLTGAARTNRILLAGVAGLANHLIAIGIGAIGQRIAIVVQAVIAGFGQAIGDAKARLAGAFIVLLDQASGIATIIGVDVAIVAFLVGLDVAIAARRLAKSAVFLAILAFVAARIAANRAAAVIGAARFILVDGADRIAAGQLAGIAAIVGAGFTFLALAVAANGRNAIVSASFAGSADSVAADRA